MNIQTSRKVTKYTIYKTALVWARYKNNWCPGEVVNPARTRAEVEITLKSGKIVKASIHYEDLMYRKLNEKEPPENVKG